MPDSRKKRVFVGLSGGVDSAVAAALLKQQGYEVAGVFMRFWSEAGHRENGCCSASAEAVARLVAAKLNIPFYVFDVAKEFKKKVVDYFLRELKAGRTPNPCVVCNPQIKFGLFLKYALKMGADYIATGHYAKLKSVVKNAKPAFKLFAAKDDKKDQSYFLVGLKQRQLNKIIFPLGDYLKREVYGIAINRCLPYRQGESFDICFIDDYQQYLKKYLKMKPGEIISQTGYALGQHQGLPLYTIGQRVSIGGPGPFYLVKKDVKKNILYVSNNEKDLLQKEMQVKKVNWLGGQAPKLPLKCKIKIRYGSEMTEAVIARSRRRRGNPVGDGDKSGLLRSARNDAVTVIFVQPQRAITPGQSAVFYGRGGEVLGGGVIL
ncbi:tRNA 2-thiouridine(34) synthase MnmA [Patescibacteria group bacterium]|nr:tRNA 2-thiouridine(34) synthase MnmA [Patescibacteria group bacterium]